MINPDLLRFKEDLKLKKRDDQTLVFDVIRRKWLVLQPEEWVRQLLIAWLTRERGYNASRFSLERGMLFNGLSRRYDLLVFAPDMRPFLLVECKAPRVRVGPDAFSQVSTYNLNLKVPYIMVSNGLQNHVFAIDHREGTFEALEDLPPYPED